MILNIILNICDIMSKSKLDNFIPATKGCSEGCVIDRKEEEICCKNGRVCCFFCFELNCPIKEEYEDLIKKTLEKLRKSEIS